MGRRKKPTIVDENQATEVKPENNVVEKIEKAKRKSIKAGIEPKIIDESISGIYSVIPNSLYIRKGPGKKFDPIGIISQGTKVTNLGGYTEINNEKWLYVAAIVDEVLYEGFCNGTFLKK